MYQIALGPRDPYIMVLVVQGPGYRKMTIRLKDAAVWGDRVTPNRAIYAFLFCNYGCKSAICVACWGLWAKYCDNVYCKYTRQSGANGIQSLDSPKSTSTGQSFKSMLHPKGTKLAESTNCIYDSLTKCPVCPQTRTTVIISTIKYENKEITHKSDLLMY